MKKRLLSFLLVAAMVMTMLPAGLVFAAEDPATADNTVFLSSAALWEGKTNAKEESDKFALKPVNSNLPAYSDTESGTNFFNNEDGGSLDTFVSVNIPEDGEYYLVSRQRTRNEDARDNEGLIPDGTLGGSALYRSFIVDIYQEGASIPVLKDDGTYYAFGAEFTSTTPTRAIGIYTFISDKPVTLEKGAANIRIRNNQWGQIDFLALTKSQDVITALQGAKTETGEVTLEQDTFTELFGTLVDNTTKPGKVTVTELPTSEVGGASVKPDEQEGIETYKVYDETGTTYLDTVSLDVTGVLRLRGFASGEESKVTLRAVNANGFVSPEASDPITFTATEDNMDPSVTAALKEGSVTYNGATIQAEATDNSSRIEKYELYVSTTEGEFGDDPVATLEKRPEDMTFPSAELSVTNLAAGVTYYAQVKAYDADGNVGISNEDVSFTIAGFIKGESPERPSDFHDMTGNGSDATAADLPTLETIMLLQPNLERASDATYTEENDLFLAGQTYGVLSSPNNYTKAFEGTLVVPDGNDPEGDYYQMISTFLRMIVKEGDLFRDDRRTAFVLIDGKAVDTNGDLVEWDGITTLEGTNAYEFGEEFPIHPNATEAEIRSVWPFNISRASGHFWGSSPAFRLKGGVHTIEVYTIGGTGFFHNLFFTKQIGYDMTSVFPGGLDTRSANWQGVYAAAVKDQLEDFTTGPSFDNEQAVTASGTTDNSISLSWNAADNGGGARTQTIYEVKYWIGDSEPAAADDNTVYVTATSTTLSGLTSGSTYNIKVTAYDYDGKVSSTTLNTTATTTGDADEEAPVFGAGEIEVSDITTTGATITWPAATDNNGTVTYDVKVDGALQGNTSQTSYTLTGLEASKTYTVTVTAKDTANNESAPLEGMVTTADLPVPEGIIYNIDSVPDENLDLREGSASSEWTQDNNNQNGVSKNNGATLLLTSGKRQITKRVYIPEDGTYYVSARMIMHGASNGPQWLWTGNVNNNFRSAIAWFEQDGEKIPVSGPTDALPYPSDPTQPFPLTKAAILDQDGTNYYAFGHYRGDGQIGTPFPQANTSYYYTDANPVELKKGFADFVFQVGTYTRVDFFAITKDAPVAAAGTSSAAFQEAYGAFQDSTEPRVTTPLAAGQEGNGYVDLTFGATDDKNGVAGYEIYLDGALYKTVDKEEFASGTYRLGLEDTDEHSVQVLAYDYSGNHQPLEDAASVTVQATGEDTTRPEWGEAQVRVLTEKPTTSADIEWDAATDTESGIAYYEVSLSNGVDYIGDPIQTSRTSTTITGLTPGTEYTVYIRAYDLWGNATANTISGTIDTITNHAPVWGEATASAAPYVDSAVLTWGAATDEEGDDITYTVYNGASILAETDQLTATITGLTQGTTYNLTIVAKDEAGATSDPLAVPAFTTLSYDSYIDTLYVDEDFEDIEQEIGEVYGENITEFNFDGRPYGKTNNHFTFPQNLALTVVEDREGGKAMQFQVNDAESSWVNNDLAFNIPDMNETGIIVSEYSVKMDPMFIENLRNNGTNEGNLISLKVTSTGSGYASDLRYSRNYTSNPITVGPAAVDSYGSTGLNFNNTPATTKIDLDGAGEWLDLKTAVNLSTGEGVLFYRVDGGDWVVSDYKRSAAGVATKADLLVRVVKNGKYTVDNIRVYSLKDDVVPTLESASARVEGTDAFFDISGTFGESGGLYKITLQKANDPEATSFSVKGTDSPVMVSGMDVSTEYSYTVQAIGTNTQKSTNTITGTFTTEAAPVDRENPYIETTGFPESWQTTDASITITGKDDMSGVKSMLVNGTAVQPSGGGDVTIPEPTEEDMPYYAVRVTDNNDGTVTANVFYRGVEANSGQIALKYDPTKVTPQTAAGADVTADTNLALVFNNPTGLTTGDYGILGITNKPGGAENLGGAYIDLATGAMYYSWYCDTNFKKINGSTEEKLVTSIKFKLNDSVTASNFDSKTFTVPAESDLYYPATSGVSVLMTTEGVNGKKYSIGEGTLKQFMVYDGNGKGAGVGGDYIYSGSTADADENGQFVVIVTDNADNVYTETIDVLVDTVTPVPEGTLTYNDVTATFSDVDATVGRSGLKGITITLYSDEEKLTEVDSISEAPYTFEGLTAETQYWYTISAENNAGGIGTSEGTFTTDEANVAPVFDNSSVTATPAAGSIALSWTAATDANPKDTVTYKITVTDKVAGTQVGEEISTTDTTYTITGLTPQTAYTITIKATDGRLEASSSYSGDTTTLADTTAPEITILFNGAAPTGTAYPDDVTITATATDDVTPADDITLEIKVGDAEPVALPADGYVVTTEFNGNITISAEDAYENEGTETQALQIVWMTPTVTASVSGGTLVDGWYTALPSITATTNGGTLEYSLDNSAWSTYNAETGVVLEDGFNGTVYFRATTSKGKVGTDDTGALKVDLNGPAITVSGNTAEWATSKTLTVTVTDAGSGVAEVTVNGAAQTITPGASVEISLPVTANGDYVIAAKDSVGHTSTKTETVSTIDTGAPTWAADAEITNSIDYVNRTATVTWPAAQDQTAVTYTVTVNDEPVATDTADLSYTISDLVDETAYAVKVTAKDALGQVSAELSMSFTFRLADGIIEMTITVSPAAGPVAAGTVITLATDNTEAKILYTTDGSDPDPATADQEGSATKTYTDGVPFTGDAMTLKYIGYLNGLVTAVNTAEYTLKPTVTFSPDGGFVSSGTAVTLTADSENAQIYYTTDGSTPTTSSTLYSGSIVLTSNCTIRAIAVVNGVSSDVVSREFMIQTQGGINTGGGGSGSGNTGGNGSGTIVTRPSNPTTTPNPNLLTHYAYVNGYEDGSVRPDSNISRQEAATLIFNLMDNASGAAAPTGRYTDLAADAWSAQAVEHLLSSGVLTMSEDGTFRPTDSVTRAEFMTMICQWQGYELASVSGDGADYGDTWAASYIQTGIDRGLLSGYEDGTYRPNNAITRAEAITVLNKVLGRTPDTARIDRISGKVFTDLEKSHWAYYEIVEATADHRYEASASGETWSEIF